MDPVTRGDALTADDGRFLLALLDRADSCIPCGWMTLDEQRRLDELRLQLAAATRPAG